MGFDAKLTSRLIRQETKGCDKSNEQRAEDLIYSPSFGILQGLRKAYAEARLRQGSHKALHESCKALARPLGLLQGILRLRKRVSTGLMQCLKGSSNPAKTFAGQSRPSRGLQGFCKALKALTGHCPRPSRQHPIKGWYLHSSSIIANATLGALCCLRQYLLLLKAIPSPGLYNVGINGTTARAAVKD